MHPNQRPGWPLQAWFAAAFGNSLRVFLAARQASRQDLWRYRRSDNGGPAIDAQSQREPIRHG
jgi:hypothetical protein